MEKEKHRAYNLVTTVQRLLGANREDVRLVCVPLRICPLGAHIDHQCGQVTGMTINATILLAYIPNRAREIRIHSLNFSPPVAFRLDDVPARGEPLWGNYVCGAVVALQQRYRLYCGIDGVISGEMPIGGLSSSAAVGGAGFRGCCIGLSDPSRREAIIEAIHREYPARHPEIKGKYSIHFCKPDGPAGHARYSSALRAGHRYAL